MVRTSGYWPFWASHPSWYRSGRVCKSF